MDYRVMCWVSDEEGPWTEAARQRYIDGQFEGVFYRFGPSVRHENLEFLMDLPGLRYLEVVGRVKDDTAAFELPDLEELILVTRSKCRPPRSFGAQQHLVRLLINYRAGIEFIQGMQRLRSLTVYQWSGPDLRFIGAKPSLERLALEGTRRLVSFAGVESCCNLTEMEVTEARADSLAPFGELRNLRRVWLVGSPRIKEENGLDLSELENLKHLEELRLTFGGRVRSLQPLSALPRLRDIRLRGTVVEDGDLSWLDELCSRAMVLGP